MDNIYGTFEEDVFRRDFAMNAVYYQPQSNEIIDPAEGVKDIQGKTIRTIGEPESRFREDPVRMIRAIRFQADWNALNVDSPSVCSLIRLNHP